ncbi:MAG: phosphoenolpyruvate carboxykinase (ATP) [Gemmatimonadaceae bacterium]
MAINVTTSAAPVRRESEGGLAQQGLKPSGQVHWNLLAPELTEAAIRRNEGRLAEMGPFVAITTPHTGRSPNDKFVVKENSSAADVDWGKVNQPISAEHYALLKSDVQNYLNGLNEVFVQDLFCGADTSMRLSVRYVMPNAWHALFVRNMFIRPELADLASFAPNFTVYHAPEFQADPAKHGTRTSTFIVLNLAEHTILIGGTRYAGELKKSMFTVMQYLLPKQNVLSMHCSANIGPEGDTALFFGLSGTGKTTLSADPERGLIGDDEHGWSTNGTFNFEGGCYAKVINLSAESEPDIYQTTQMFGTVLENVVLSEPTRKVEFENQSITENTRASYPLHYIKNHVPSGRGGHPKNVVFLTADAFGVLPPISRLTPEQAMYYFLSGYTAKVAGTERGVTEPQATFSACFGAVFLVWHPTKYAHMLGDLLKQHNAQVWLVNTGWSGGAYGVGSRMKLSHTRAMVRAALAGKIGNATTTDPIFGLHMPTAIEDVPAEVLDPRKTWKDAAAYDTQAKKLAEMFRENIKKFGDAVTPAILGAGPKG